MEEPKVTVTTCKVNLNDQDMVKAILETKPITAIYEKMYADVQQLLGIEEMECKCPSCLMGAIHTPDGSKQLPNIYTVIVKAYQESFDLITKVFTSSDATKMILPLVIIPQLAPKMVENIPGGIDMLIDIYIQSSGSDNAEEDLDGLASWDRINQIFLDTTFMVCKGFDMGRGRMEMPPEVAEVMAARIEAVPAGTTLQ